MASYYIVSYSYSGSGQTGYTNIVEEALKAKSLERSGEPDWTARIGDKSSGKVEEHKKADGGLDESVTEGWVTKGLHKAIAEYEAKSEIYLTDMTEDDLK
ncbi:hypothetical protein BU26DRAFT_565855 [Trematosphaeria pertusa]|uniref:Uncharacterized protein n=1 Tax=Trematosphaeria pertusa TaxID=390896 RepID=A0A6A6IDJ4_9PLEO|nr:uncharacterized protein BU26DRAFT_565855 [Trematosphaeria pertusa]KAF2248461.1 hypothetical protein BU26DRAFT_565855 [Trematosphaeria pertusa]